MPASRTSIFGDFSRPKSPQSASKGIKGLENPLIKSGEFSSLSGGEVPTSYSPLLSTQRLIPRTALIAMNSNHDFEKYQQQEQKNIVLKTRKPHQLSSTPGTPPKASLSLMGGMTLPLENKNNRDIVTPKPQTTQEVQSIDVGFSIPVPVTSPPFSGGNKSDTSNDSLFGEEEVSGFVSSESHWVVAHGYASSTEYEEMFAILSSFGRIIRLEASGNWLAVQFESRLSAEKAICSQPILLANSLCGIARGTPSLLQKLNTGKEQSKRQPQNTAQGKEQNTKKKILTSTTGNLNENDILLLENTSFTGCHQHNKKNSICEKILAWYFGWDEGHSHLD